MSGNSTTYEFQPSFILGFHGCDRTVGESILNARRTKHLTPSQKDYDWLGHGIYFWEGNPSRAMEWAKARKREGKIKEPFVLGAIIDLRHCLDLFDSSGLQQVKDAHDELISMFELLGIEAPKNVGKTPDKAGRALDCAVMNYLHGYRQSRAEIEFDSIRGPFLEGGALYPSAGFQTHNHIQLCIRNNECIKGYFRPINAKVSN